MEDRDLYNILGISKNASNEDIKKAYRSLAKRIHPDKNPDDADAAKKFAECSEAYQILSDSNKRRSYDDGGIPKRHRYAWRQKRSSYKQRAKGKDVLYPVYVSIEQLCHKESIHVKAKSNESCSQCFGVGIKKGASKRVCSTCNGLGKQRNTVSNNGFSAFVEQLCRTCAGKGHVVRSEDKCTLCDGTGLTYSNKSLFVVLEPGLRHGMRIHRPGEGLLSSSDSTRGNAVFEIRVKDHDVYSLEGEVIVLSMPITIEQAMMGDSINIPTPYGNQEIYIKAGTENNSVYMLKRFGLPDKRGNKGILAVKVWYETPKMSKKDICKIKDLLKGLSSESATPHTKSRLEEIKKYMEKNNGNGKKNV